MWEMPGLVTELFILEAFTYWINFFLMFISGIIHEPLCVSQLPFL